MNMRLPCIAALALALGLSACGAGSFGTPAAGFAFPQVGQSYIPLHKRDWTLATHDGASVVIAPGIAVTNAHNAGMIDPAAVIGRVEGYDLLYYRTAKNAVLPIAVPVNGQQVIANFMPWWLYRNLAPSDLDAIVAYLRSLPAVKSNIYLAENQFPLGG